MQTQETYPIHTFNKNLDEEIRISIRKYKGRCFIDLRLWFESKKDKEYHPTKKGVFFPLEQLPEFKKGIDRLLKSVEKFRTPEEMAV